MNWTNFFAIEGTVHSGSAVTMMVDIAEPLCQPGEGVKQAVPGEGETASRLTALLCQEARPRRAADCHAEIRYANKLQSRQ